MIVYSILKNMQITKKVRINYSYSVMINRYKNINSELILILAKIF